MKTIGIAMLFGLCALIGCRLGARKTMRLRTVRSLRCDLQLLRERIAASSDTLVELTAKQNGLLFACIGTYLERIMQGESDAAAAAHAAKELNVGETACAGVELFLTGLYTAARSDLLNRSQSLSATLERAENEAEAEAKQTRVLQISGVLAGAGLAILLW